MVSAYHVNAAVGEGKAQGIAVSSGLDGGIAFYERALVVVIGIGEPQVCRAGLGRELLALQRASMEEVQLMGGSEVQYVQVYFGSSSHFKGFRGRCVASLLTAYERVVFYGRLTAVLGCEALHVCVDD